MDVTIGGCSNVVVDVDNQLDICLLSCCNDFHLWIFLNPNTVNTLVSKVVVNTADVNTIVIYLVAIYTALFYMVIVDMAAVNTPVFN